MASMQACGGSSTMIISIQQTVGAKRSFLPSKWMGISRFPNHVKLGSMKPCRSSILEGSVATGKPQSPVSVHIPEIRGDGSSFADRQFRSLEFIASKNFTS